MGAVLGGIRGQNMGQEPRCSASSWGNFTIFHIDPGRYGVVSTLGEIFRVCVNLRLGYHEIYAVFFETFDFKVWKSSGFDELEIRK